MKFLVDMGLARATVAFLQTSGHDAVHLRDLGLQRLPDADIVGLAQREHRVILTHDLDFGRIVALSGDRVPSVVTFRLGDMRPASVNAHVAEIVTRFPTELARGALVTVTDRGIRLRRLPVTGASQAE